MVGRCGEQAAVDHLEKHGMMILARNWSSRLGELDIIAKNQREIIFVEVRTTTSRHFGFGYQSVDKRKQQKVRRLATQYIQQNQLWNQSIRFDVISVMLDRQYNVKQLDHFTHAF